MTQEAHMLFASCNIHTVNPIILSPLKLAIFYLTAF